MKGGYTRRYLLWNYIGKDIGRREVKNQEIQMDAQFVFEIIKTKTTSSNR